MIQSTMVKYKDILEKIVASDYESTNQVYDILNKEIDSASDSRKEFIDYADKVGADLSKCLDNPNLTPEQQKDILDRQMEIFHSVDKKDDEIREHEMEMARMADKKDTEKKEFNWKMLGAASFVVLTAVGIGTAALGGKFDSRNRWYITNVENIPVEFVESVKKENKQATIRIRLLIHKGCM